jgi:lipid II:glycine glycyltransferase (peptidoglycan interpeptide bridge formation enzyme)
MTMYTVAHAQASGADWNAIVAAMPDPHLLQTWEWADTKAFTGWAATPLVWREAGGTTVAAAMLLIRQIPSSVLAAKLSIAYVPKGPLMDWSNQALRQQVLSDLKDIAQRRGAIHLKIDPDVILAEGDSALDGQPVEANPLGQQIESELGKTGWIYSHEQIQFRNTVFVDLAPEEPDLLAAMKQKTRYNVRLAGRKGVSVRVGGQADLELLHQMYAETSIRDGFVIRVKPYYISLWQTFLRAGYLEPLIAEVEGDPVAAIMVFRFANRCWYVHGMSLPIHRKLMPNYLLQWEAMRRARAAGYQEYDLWGAPEVYDESDPLWGVYRFKRGFGGRVVRTLGAWDLPLRPVYFKLYAQVLPVILGWMRRLGKRRTRAAYGTE